MEITGEKVGRWNYLESKMQSRLLEDQVQLLTDCPSHAVKTLKLVSLASLISICVAGEAEGRRHDRGWRGFSVLLKDWGSTIQVVHTWIAVQCFYHACGRSRSTGNPKYWTCFIDSHRLDVAHTTSMSWHILETHLSAMTKQVMFPPPWSIIGESGTYVVKVKTYRESIMTSEATEEKGRHPLYCASFQ